MNEEKVTIIGGHKFFIRGDGSSGIVPNDETKEENIKTEEIEKYSSQMQLYGLAYEISKLYERWDELRTWLEDKKIEKYYDNDAYRYTAYMTVLEKMDELEKENKYDRKI